MISSAEAQMKAIKPYCRVGREEWPWRWPEQPQWPSTEDVALPSISVVIPSLNQGQYIETTLRSILGQGYPRLELIVIDGGSCDETVRVLEHYDDYIDYWVSEADEGQSHAINKGLARASGTVFNWINSDDYLAPGALWHVGRAFGGNENAGIHAVVGITRNFIDETEYVYPVESRNISARNLIREPLGSGIKWHQPSIWLRTGLARDVGGVPEWLHYFFDLYLFTRYFRRYPNIRYLDNDLVFFRLHGGSKTGKGRLAFLAERVRVVESLRELPDFAELHEDLVQAGDALRWEVYCTSSLHDRSRSRLGRAFEILRDARGANAFLSSKMTRKTIRRILLRGGPKRSAFQSMYQHPPGQSRGR